MISDAEVTERVGAGDGGGHTGSVDSGGGDTGHTGADSGDTDTGVDTAVETGETGIDSADTDETGTDMGDTSVDTGDTGADYVSAAGGTMIHLSAGTFSMGSGLGDPDGAYVDHDVTLTHDFYLAQTETTRGEWESDPSNTGWTYSSLPDYPCTGTSADCPADTMTWYDAAMYANWLSAEEGRTECYLTDGTDMAAAYIADPYSCPGYRLPTEAEWEYSARAGEDTTYAGSDTAADVAWTYDNAYAMGTNSHEVATLDANAWGLYDMSGNVYEWTNDWYDSAYGGYSGGAAATDPPGPSSGSRRVTRGCSWISGTSGATVSDRTSDRPVSAGNNVGFRLARSIP